MLSRECSLAFRRSQSYRRILIELLVSVSVSVHSEGFLSSFALLFWPKKQKQQTIETPNIAKQTKNMTHWPHMRRTHVREKKCKSKAWHLVCAHKTKFEIQVISWVSRCRWCWRQHTTKSIGLSGGDLWIFVDEKESDSRWKCEPLPFGNNFYGLGHTSSTPPQQSTLRIDANLFYSANCSNCRVHTTCFSTLFSFVRRTRRFEWISARFCLRRNHDDSDLKKIFYE